MSAKDFDPANRKDNLRFLRHYLGLTQKDFIARFLTDEDEPLISVAAYSNLESKGGARMDDVILRLSEALSIDILMFSEDPHSFTRDIELLLPREASADGRDQSSASRKGNVDQILNRLTMYFAEQMLERKLKKGDRIESERILASKLGVGRSSVREALKVLDVMGMIEICPGQGTFISAREENFFTIPLSWSLFLSAGQIENILTVRNVLEIKAAELAASCTDPDAIARLHEISHNLHVAYMDNDPQRLLEEDLKFHLCIAECSGNPVIMSQIQTIRNLMAHVSKTGMVDAAQLKEINKEHQKVFGLIIAGDGAGAAEAMRLHLENAARRYDYR